MLSLTRNNEYLSLRVRQILNFMILVNMNLLSTVISKKSALLGKLFPVINL